MADTIKVATLAGMRDAECVAIYGGWAVTRNLPEEPEGYRATNIKSGYGMSPPICLLQAGDLATWLAANLPEDFNPLAPASPGAMDGMGVLAVAFDEFLRVHRKTRCGACVVCTCERRVMHLGGAQ